MQTGKTACFNLNFSNPGGTSALQSLILSPSSKANVSFCWCLLGETQLISGSELQISGFLHQNLNRCWRESTPDLLGSINNLRHKFAR
jgi:hypothetical protein